MEQNGRKRQKAILRVAWVVCVLVVIVGSLLPGDSRILQAVEDFVPSDKLQHICAYAGLAFLPAIHEPRRVWAGLLVLIAVMGVMLEFGQLFSLGRSFDLHDMAADGFGILAGTLAGLPLRARVRARLAG